jgi:hypothetical protein
LIIFIARANYPDNIPLSRNLSDWCNVRMRNTGSVSSPGLLGLTSFGIDHIQ